MINLKTVKALGITCPNNIIISADKLIDGPPTSGFGTYRTCPAKLTMSVDRSKADLALGRIGAFTFAPLVSPSVMRG